MMDNESTKIILCARCQQRLRVPVRIGKIRVKCPNPECRLQWEMDTGERPYEPVRLPYQVVDIQQGTAAWHAWRDQGLGASDAPTIMGENPWKSRGKLLDEKLRRVRVRASEAMARGTALEPEARKQYERKTGISVRPLCLQSTKFYWLLKFKNTQTTFVSYFMAKSNSNHSCSKKD